MLKRIIVVIICSLFIGMSLSALLYSQEKPDVEVPTETLALDSNGMPQPDNTEWPEKVYTIDTVKYEQDGYVFRAIYNDSLFTSTLEIDKDGRAFLSGAEMERIESIRSYDLEGTGKKNIVIEEYTGGAHCCTLLYIGEITSSGFSIKDTIFWGDSGYEIKDINGDGKLEIEGAFTGFGYAYTSFAESAFPVLIYAYKNGKMTEVTGDFKNIVEKDIAELKLQLKEYKNYECPDTEDDIWGSGAGNVKAILAAITYDYSSMGQADKGYKMIDKYYKCDDKEKFKKELRTTYKLK